MGYGSAVMDAVPADCGGSRWISLKQGPVAAALAANAVSERKRFFLPVEAEVGDCPNK